MTLKSLSDGGGGNSPERGLSFTYVYMRLVRMSSEEGIASASHASIDN